MSFQCTILDYDFLPSARLSTNKLHVQFCQKPKGSSAQVGIKPHQAGAFEVETPNIHIARLNDFQFGFKWHIGKHAQVMFWNENPIQVCYETNYDASKISPLQHFLKASTSMVSLIARQSDFLVKQSQQQLFHSNIGIYKPSQPPVEM